ncbi:hypothetical protein ABZ281_22310 [Streptomyces sp. NPDC006265]|uniref:hypothetical protein n=1 Tax=Streptomyces sp. NPDC006265 TaxID=3156740 RepID=UPI0033B838F4
MKFRTTMASTGVLAATAAAVLVVAGPAAASVALDPATGTGFVGKGDVQTSFAWNNKQLQTNSDGVSFTYATTTHYSAVCE